MKFINWLKVWFKAARAPFLIVSIVPGTLAGIMALKAGMWNGLHFALALVGAVLAHSAGDFFDDYYDFKSNTLGHKEQQFHDSPIIHGQVTAGQVLWAGIGCSVIALGIGAYFLITVGLPIVYIAAVTGLIAVFYTAPPVRLNFMGFGETGLFFAFGPLLTLGIWTAVTGKDFDTFCRQVNLQAAACLRWGVRAALHNHMGTLVETQRQLEAFLARCPECGLILDTAHLAAVGGDPLEIVRRYADRLQAVHLKDWLLTQPDALQWYERGRFCELGAGNIDLDNAAVLRALREVGYDGWVFVEHDTHLRDPLQDLAVSREYIRSVIF